MKIIHGPFESKEKFENIYIAIGTFDGVHRGHKKLILQMKDAAKKNKGNSAIFTFSNHPLEIIKKNTDPKNITTLEEKIYLLDKLGIDYLFLQDFDQKFSDMTAQDFISSLKTDLDVKEIFVGFNFTFGKNGSGNTDILQKLGNEMNIKTDLLPAVKINNNIISSTTIRNFLSNGNIEKVNEYLGYTYFVSGKVVHGKRIARSLGFPTANIELKNKLLPHYGVYGAKVTLPDISEKKLGIVNIGDNPTLKSGTISFEVNIFDYDGDLYDKTIKIELLKFIRPEEKFSSIEELKKTINSNIKDWIAENKSE